MALLTANAAALHAGGAAREDDGLIAALGAILADRKLEPAFIALALAPPSEADVAREIGRDVDPDAIFAARKQLRASIGERLGAALADTYRAHGQHGALPAGRRRRRPALAQEHLPCFARGDGTRRRHRADGVPVRQRRQHDRPHGGAGDFGAGRPALNARMRWRISTAATPTIR